MELQRRSHSKEVLSVQIFDTDKPLVYFKSNKILRYQYSKETINKNNTKQIKNRYKMVCTCRVCSCVYIIDEDMAHQMELVKPNTTNKNAKDLLVKRGKRYRG